MSTLVNPASFLMSILEGPPMPAPGKPSWTKEVKVDDRQADKRLTPAQSPVFYDIIQGMRNRMDELTSREAKLLEELDLARREHTAINAAYSSALAFALPDSIQNAARTVPAQEAGGRSLRDIMQQAAATPA
jgi:hypothetical protein